MIKNIIIDFGGVIGTDADTIFTVVLSKHGIPKESALEIWNKHWDAMANGSEHVESVWKTVKEYTTSDINNVIGDYHGLIDVNQNMLDLCSEMKKKGYKMGVLANETIEWMNIKREKGKLNDIFDVVYSSADIKFPKPQNEAYLKTLESLNAKPEETLFIDDHERNIKAAEALGMQGLVFKNIVQLKNDLSEINVI